MEKKEWSKIFKSKKKMHQSRLFYVAKHMFNYKGLTSDKLQVMHMYIGNGDPTSLLCEVYWEQATDNCMAISIN